MHNFKYLQGWCTSPFSPSSAEKHSFLCAKKKNPNSLANSKSTSKTPNEKDAEEPLQDHLQCRHTDRRQWRCRRRVKQNLILIKLSFPAKFILNFNRFVTNFVTAFVLVSGSILNLYISSFCSMNKTEACFDHLAQFLCFLVHKLFLFSSRAIASAFSLSR